MTRLRNLLLALLIAGLFTPSATFTPIEAPHAAFARDEYTATGGQTDFTITFAYISETHVEVFEDGVQATNSASGDDNFTIVGGSTVRFNTGRTADVLIVVQRDTSQSSRLVDFTVPSTLVESDLDNDSLQAFYMAQEAIDAAEQALGLVTGTVLWDGESRRLTAIATPTAGTDAVTKDYADALAIGGAGITTPVSVALGGTGSATASAARTALGVAIGTDVQAELAVPSQAEAEAGTATTERVWTAQRVGQAVAAVSGPLPTNYGTGAIISQDTDTDHDTNVTAGAWRNADDDGDLVLASEQTKQIDASWATGDDAGGLSSSLTVANNTWYHIFLILVGGTVEVGIDTSTVAANLITDHSATEYRLIESVFTDGSANIIGYTANADCVNWKVPRGDYLDANPGTAAVSRTLSTPLGRKVLAQHSVSILDDSPSAFIYGLISSLDQTDTAPSISIHDFYSAASAGTDSAGFTASAGVRTNTSSQIRTRISVSAADVDLTGTTHGWCSRRGKDG